MSHNAERELRDKLQDQGWFVVRAAGSLGAVDLIAVNPYRVLAPEVKASSETLQDGTVVCRLTSAAGHGVEQRDLLADLAEAYPMMDFGFILKAKGRWLADHVPRWTWFPIVDVKDETVLRTTEGTPLDEAFK